MVDVFHGLNIRFFKKYKTLNTKQFIIANIVSVLVLMFVFKMLFPFTLKYFSVLELFFVNSIGLPFNSGSIIGAVLLALGLLTRFISIPLLFVMVVAIATVHGAHGFHVIMPGDAFSWENPYINGTEVPHTVVVLQNGYEMVMYYMAMLMVLVSKGAGRLSLDFLIFKKA